MSEPSTPHIQAPPPPPPSDLADVDAQLKALGYEEGKAYSAPAATEPLPRGGLGAFLPKMVTLLIRKSSFFLDLSATTRDLIFY